MRIKVTPKVPPITTNIDGTLTKIIKGPPSDIAEPIIPNAASMPTRLAISTLGAPQKVVYFFMSVDEFLADSENYQIEASD